MENHIHTIDIKLAAILTTHGIPRRSYDPITCVVEDNGHKQFTFWFDGTLPHHGDLARDIIKQFFSEKNKGNTDCIVVDTEDIVSMQMGALRIRDQLMSEMYSRVTPLVRKEIGDKVVFIAQGASQKTKDKIRSMI